MAVIHSSSSESHTGATGSSNQGSFNWTHTQTSTPQGVLVFVHTINSFNDDAGTVTYGSTTLSRVTGANAVDIGGEPGRTVAYFAGSGLPSGNQTVTVNRTNNSNVMYATVATVTAAADTDTAGVLVEQNNQTLTEENVDDGSPGANSIRYLGLYSGRGAFGNQSGRITPGANSTAVQTIDFGARVAGLYRETVAGQGSRPVGVSCTTSDDVAAVYLAIIEAASAEPELLADVRSYVVTGNDVVFATDRQIEANKGAFSLTGNDATFFSGLRLSADPGAFSLAGQAAGFLEDKRLAADVQSYALTGNDAGLHVVTNLDVNAGSFALTGNDAGFTQAQVLTADTRSFSVTGADVTLSKTEVLEADPATFALTGQAVTTTKQYILTSDLGTFNATGNSAVFTKTILAPVDVGTFALTGGSPVLSEVYFLSGGTGNFTETGPSVVFARTWNLTAGTGGFTLTGNTVALTLLGAYEVALIVGSFTLTGSAATLRETEKTEALAGAFALTGNEAGLLNSRSLSTEAGNFAVTGNDTGLLKASSLNADLSSSVLTGQATTLRVDRNLAAISGAFNVIGSDASFIADSILSGDAQLFALTGNDVTLSLASAGNLELPVSAGAFALTGNAVSLPRTWALSADIGNFVGTGQPDLLLKQSLIVPEVKTFVLTGNDATTADFESLNTSTESLVLTGLNVNLQKAGTALEVEVEAVAFALSGKSVTLQRQYVLTAQAARFRLRFGARRRVVFLF